MVCRGTAIDLQDDETGDISFVQSANERAKTTHLSWLSRAFENDRIFRGAGGRLIDIPIDEGEPTSVGKTGLDVPGSSGLFRLQVEDLDPGIGPQLMCCS